MIYRAPHILPHSTAENKPPEKRPLAHLHTGASAVQEPGISPHYPLRPPHEIQDPDCSPAGHGQTGTVVGM